VDKICIPLLLCWSMAAAQPTIEIGDVWTYDFSLEMLFDWPHGGAPSGVTRISFVDTVRTDSGLGRVFRIETVAQVWSDTLKGTMPFYLYSLFTYMGTLYREKTVTVADTQRVLRQYSNNPPSMLSEYVYQYFLDSTVALSVHNGEANGGSTYWSYQAVLLEYNGKDYRAIVGATPVGRHGWCAREAGREVTGTTVFDLFGRRVRSAMAGLLVVGIRDRQSRLLLRR
jgi:hypothetical protein